ncbi:MAG: hypothetical protein LC722_06860 [Actinobacteria bacterium]|nr:hypothetical protein [Actinomycetota bacterium]
MSERSNAARYREDLVSAVRAWRLEPKMALIAAALALVSLVPDPWWFLFLPVSLFAVGWSGTQLVFYLRAFRGLPITTGELWRFTWRFAGRYFTLGLVLAVPLLAGAFVVAVITGNPKMDRSVLSVGAAALTALMAFVAPALAYSTRRVTIAVRIGLGMLRQTWPLSGWYAIVPAAVNVLALGLVLGGRGLNRFLFPAALAVANFAFAGAVAAFFLRRHGDVGDDGAVNASHLETLDRKMRERFRPDEEN